ncbi:TonB-dependent receptor [Asticcacaulis sp. 201]|uniref:TonB-dependent receptor n=1 Tax=Asticcacaulis sp. 201 TaxID=3028787 RepID=UPI002916D02A|nr:TonB-dependent receptor [Asticcacaulis sp. 201]MDV6329349.1 TonB-dependent receptor [Asticcacaulis sp. 201]
MKLTYSRALVIALVSSASLLPFLPFAARADTTATDDGDTPKEVIVVGQKNTPITVAPRGLSVSLGHDQFEAINAVNVEDLMKYAPNFFVRKRFIGDDNAVVALRGTNTIQSARTLVLVDGYVVSNFLGNRWDYPPKWNVVGPSEVRQFDIVYGPYSARYGGNSMGGVVSITTETPKRNDVYATAQTFVMPFKEYGFDQTFSGYSFEGGADYKSKTNGLSARASFRHFENTGQSMTYNLLTKSTAAGTYIPVTGAYADPRLATPVFGAASPVDVVQDQARLRVGYAWDNGWKADALMMLWRTAQDLNDARSWLTDSAGNTILTTAAGTKVRFNGVNYIAKGVTYSTMDRNESLTGAKLSGSLSGWDVTTNLSHYDIGKWDARTSLDMVGANGQQTVYDHPGWWTFDSTIEQAFGHHDLAFGVTSNQYATDATTYNTTNWRTASGAVFSSRTFGKTAISGLFAEDQIDLEKAVLTLGLRYDDWRAFDGGIAANGVTKAYANRRDNAWSPKISLQGDVGAYNLQLSAGTATRFPTVGELFQGRINAGQTEIDPTSFDPNLKPEVSHDLSLIARRRLDRIVLTGSLFGQSIDDAVFSYQGVLDDGTVVSRYQNIDHMEQYGLELIFEGHDLIIPGLTVEASASWMDAHTTRNRSAPASEGKQFPRIPRWRSNGNLRYAFTPKLKGSVGWRVASRPNSDLFGLVRGDAYGFQTEYAFVDARISYDITKTTQISFGVDNANNDQAYVSHPMPQRTFMLELKYRN